VESWTAWSEPPQEGEEAEAIQMRPKKSLKKSPRMRFSKKVRLGRTRTLEKCLWWCGVIFFVISYLFSFKSFPMPF
jgi:hypothetical protein